MLLVGLGSYVSSGEPHRSHTCMTETSPIQNRICRIKGGSVSSPLINPFLFPSLFTCLSPARTSFRNFTVVSSPLHPDRRLLSPLAVGRKFIGRLDLVQRVGRLSRLAYPVPRAREVYRCICLTLFPSVYISSYSVNMSDVSACETPSVAACDRSGQSNMRAYAGQRSNIRGAFI